MTPSTRQVDTFEFEDQATAEKAETELNAMFPASAQLLNGGQVLVIVDDAEMPIAAQLARSLGGRGWKKNEMNG